MSKGGNEVIGIIGAMEEEVNAILKLMDISTKQMNHGYTFYEGTMNGKSVVLVQGGIGKVNAAVSATLLLTQYDIHFVLNIGSAGGLSLNQNVGDVVVSTGVLHHDVDVTAFGRQLGEVPGMPIVFQPDKRALKQVEMILNDSHQAYHLGLIVSGDQFVGRSDQVKTIKENFPEAMCVEMEAASIAQVCHVFKVPFIITRSLSDIYQKGENHVQFDEYLKKASESSASMCYRLVSILEQ